jgi:t-SNARE complex subunit (syntaxin)
VSPEILSGQPPPPRKMKPTTKKAIMTEFFKNVGVVQNNLSTIRRNIDKLEAMRSSILQATTPKQESEVRAKVDEIVTETNKALTLTKSQVETIAIRNIQFEVQHPNSSESRVRNNMHQALVRRLREHLTSFQKFQTSFADDVRSKAVRQLQMVLPDATLEEARSLVENGATVSDAIQQKMMQVDSQDQQLAHKDIVEKLYGLQDRVSDLKRLEQSVADLHQMFVEMAALVDRQGEMLDHIEFSVTTTKQNTAAAEQALIQARKSQHKASKRMMMIFCCCAILLVCVLFPTIAIGCNVLKN